MTFKDNIHHTLKMLADLPRKCQVLAQQLRDLPVARPWLAMGLVLASGVVLGVGMRSTIGMAENASLRAQLEQQDDALALTRVGAQREINALAARLGELQAQANRLNALGERLTHVGELADGEFNFDQPIAVGGAGPVDDMPPQQLNTDLARLETQYDQAQQQLSVLESLLFNRELDRNATPSGDPIAGSYITSGYGRRSDPIRGGSQFHKGIDFEADVGDPVLSVANGVVSFAGRRSGYGKVIEIDHGNGYVTRFAHNSRLLLQVGDLVRSGQQIARAGSTGRSTGAHVHFEVWKNGRVVNPGKFLGTHHG